MKELLPIVDTLEKALAEAKKSENNSRALMEGIELTLSKFISTLEKHGVKGIEALNKPFDPSLHEALASEERDDVAPMTVVQELEKGYIMKGRVLRPSRVIVSVEPKKKEENQQELDPVEEKKDNG
jgi:molecular chaperone GrpE